MPLQTQDDHSEFYSIHGILGIEVRGCHNPIGEVINREFQNFRDRSGKPDLTIFLGSAPSADWVPRGFPVGDKLLCDSEIDEVTVLLRSVSVNDNIRFLVRGDTKDSRNPVSIYMPTLRVKARAWVRIVCMLLKNDFLSAEEAVADDILVSFVEPFLYYRLPSHGYSLVHAAAVSNGSGILFYGSSNVGKTSMALHMAKEGCEFFGDDLVIVDEDGRLLSYPKRVKLEAQHLAVYPELVQRIGSKMSPGTQWLFHRFVKRSSQTPFQMMFYHPAISEIFDEVRIGDHCDLRAVVYLRRTAQEDLSLHETTLESCLETLTMNLFWEFDAPAYRHNQYRHCLAYASNNDFLKQEVDHHSKVTRLLTKAISKARAFELQLPPKFEAQQIKRAIDKLLCALS